MPVRASTSSTASGSGYSEAIIAISSRTERSRISAPVCSMAPTAPASIASRGVRPNKETLPPSGRSSPSSMSIVVDLPAPFGPSSATVSPRAMSTSIPFTASTTPRGVLKDFVSPCSRMSVIAFYSTAGRVTRGCGQHDS